MDSEPGRGAPLLPAALMLLALAIAITAIVAFTGSASA